MLLQVPEASAEWLLRIFRPHDKSVLLTLTLFVPYLFIVSFLSAALTFESVARFRGGEPGSLASTWLAVQKRIGTLIPVSFLTGAMLALSLFLLAPFYLFVPSLVMSEKKLPWSVYLHRSKTIAKRRLLPVIGIVVALVIVSLALDLLPPLLGAPVLLLTGSLFGILISYYFFDLRDITTA